MQAWMWRLTDEHAVLYTSDRPTLQAVLAYARFPHRDVAGATTYTGRNGRVLAWQFTFPSSLWNGVVRYLGRASVTFLEEEQAESKKRRKPAGTTAAKGRPRRRRRSPGAGAGAKEPPRPRPSLGSPGRGPA